MTGDRAWMDQAACRDEPTRQFTDPQTGADVRAALATCRRCPVRQPCLTTALNHGPEADAGIWGGTTETQRRQLRTDRGQPDTVVSPDRTQEVPPRRPTNSGRKQPATNMVRRLAAPEVTVARIQHGDYASADGRVLIFRIHGTRPWALAINGRPIAATQTATEARRIAWTQLHEKQQTVVSRPETARPGLPARRAR